MDDNGGVTGLGSGNPWQDMLDYAYLLNSGVTEPRMSIENDEYS